MGASVEYRQVDVSQQNDVDGLIQSIENDYGQINGILHSAGIIRDNFILKKTVEEFQEVLTPKVAGTVFLDQATKHLSLDFFVLFSSGVGAVGNVGQGDYACANAFLDAYANYRNCLVKCGQRHGWALSINWPLWKEGGMRVDEATEKMMMQTTGMLPMQTSTGTKIFYKALASGTNQVMIMEGDLERLRTAVLKQQSTTEAFQISFAQDERRSISLMPDDVFQKKVTNYFIKLLASTLKLSVDRIQAGEPLEKYGIDSIMAMELTNQLEKLFGSLSKTLFFEYQTIQEIADYFVRSYGGRLREILGLNEGTGGVESAGPEGIIATAFREQSHPSRFASIQKLSLATPESNVLDIAIIGLSGRYPQARDLEQYWKNLCNSKDCISEVPSDRWDWREYYSEDRNQVGRHYSKWGGFIEDVDRFDPLFFNISPREAALLDPQERLFLEAVWTAVEDAGYSSKGLVGEVSDYLSSQVGVYAGVMYGEYQLFGAEASLRGNQRSTNSIYASIANRISYVFNLHGPSMTVDTMCSSSLTALHLAFQDLKLGRTDLGIAGGVNVTIHPNKYLLLSSGQFISSRGHCESFGQGGDGYIPGEGVGVAVLKRLVDAERDGDHIYGVVKGSAVNHGGKTNGYSVPNPNAQQMVIARALKEAEIDSRTISYVEAHGTGTKLGDPIEITGLTKAFEKTTKERPTDGTQGKQYCWIGSVKSNIGHCESAAGIAGVTKVLLQMQHGKIVPSLHSKHLNPHIDFAATPFVVNQELRNWKRPEVDGSPMPRLAGISSFGAGGSNAHIIIEEYAAKSEVRSSQRNSGSSPVQWGQNLEIKGPYLIVLSAKNEERLKEIAKNLHSYLTVSRKSETLNLRDVAYTLQVGRMPMEERLAIIVRSRRELEEKLSGYAEGDDTIEDLFRGQAKRHKETLAVFIGDEELQEGINKWIQRKKYEKLLHLWVKGLTFDWNRLYGNTKPRRISLPTYPFTKERYWIDSSANQIINHKSSRLHQLVHENTSSFEVQRFSSTFTGKEIFLKDHLVQGQKVLPGAAYLEMARAAVDKAADFIRDAQTGIQLKNVTWSRPVVVGTHSVQVHIALFPKDNGEIDYEIYKEAEPTEKEPFVHSQGRAVLNSIKKVPALEIRATQAQCIQVSLLPDDGWEAFKNGDVRYDSGGNQGLQKLYVGSGKVLAKLSLSSCVSNLEDGFILHPSLLDSALLASTALNSKDSSTTLLPNSRTTDQYMTPDNQQLFFPIALKELEIFDSYNPTMWALARYSRGGTPGDTAQKVDIDLCDDQGNICACFRGFSARVPEGEIQANPEMKSVGPETRPVTPPVGTITLTPVWDIVSIKKGKRFPLQNEKVVIVGGTNRQRMSILDYYSQAHILDIESNDTIDEINKKLETQRIIDHIVWLAPYHELKSLAEETLINQQNRGVLLCFRVIKALLYLGYGTRNLGWSVITLQSQSIHNDDKVIPTHASIHGLMGSLAKEYPTWKIRVVDMEVTRDWPLAKMFSLPPDSEGNVWCCRSNQWYRQQLITTQNLPIGQDQYKSGGVYVVLGGAGGIGAAWTQSVIKKYKAQIIWIGRRPKDAVIQAKLDLLAESGPVPTYIQANATDQKSMEKAYQEIKQTHSQIHGVIHSTIVLLDRSLATMDEECFRKSMRAKIDVSVRLAQVFQKEPLDFCFVFLVDKRVCKNARAKQLCCRVYF